jgi:hypothetical protein
MDRSRTTGRRPLPGVLLVAALVAVTLAAAALLAAGTVGAVAGPQSVASAGLDASGTAAAQPEANNTTHHDNPDTVWESDDLTGTRSHLARELARTLGESSILVSQGQYERARHLVDDDTRDLLGKYVDVAGQTDEEDDDETAEEFEETRETQERFVDETHSYEETYQEYQEAREAGDTRRARQLARELDRTARNVSRNGRTLIVNYQNVSNRTGVDLEDAEEAVNETVENVTERQEEVREVTFTETTLTVEAGADSFSFRDPLALEGRLVDENGTAIADRTVRIQVGQRVRSVDLGADGTFAVDYRPVLLHADAERVPVRYRPDETSPFLGSATNVTASVESVIPEATVSVDRDAARFGDEVTVSGRVTVDGTGVDGLPMVVTLGETRLGTVRTDADGRFAIDGTVPADVRPGERAAAARVDVENRAVEATSAETALRIEATATDLAVDAERTAEGIRTTGRLATVDGRPVPGRTVQVLVDGRTVTTVETDAEGRYEAAVPAPDDGTDQAGGATEEANVTVAFSGAGTNLEPSRASTVVALTAGQDGGDDADGGTGSGLVADAASQVSDAARQVAEFLAAIDRAVLAAVAGVAVMLLVTAVQLLARRWGGSPAPEPVETPGVDDGSSTSGSSAPEATLLTRARETLADDPREATRLGYGAVRERFGGDDAATHWEFYRDASERLDDADPLRRLTETYERAVFGHGVDSDEAESAVESATALTRGETVPDGGAGEE